MSTTPKRSLARPRPSYGINTASTPNLSASYNGANPYSSNSYRTSPARKGSLTSLTQGSLATIPDASEGYGLSTVLDDSPTADRMARRQSEADVDVEVGDFVDVPGNMHGVVKFVGNVNGKKGTFAGVELSEDFANRGKNNGDVDGYSYFVTSIDGAGIFLPINRAIRRSSPPTSASSFPLTPTTPAPLSTSRIGGKTFTPPTPGISQFSKSMGPGRAPSPQHKTARPSLPRPESPVRRLQSTTPGPRPSIGTPNVKASMGNMRYAPSPTPGKFSQSVRGTRDVVGDPAKKLGLTPRPGLKAPPRSASALSQNQIVSDDETTPVNIGSVRSNDKGSLGSISSFREKLQPAESRANAEEITRLRKQLEERDGQLKEQASSLAEMESSLTEVQALMNGADVGGRNNRSSMEDKDASQLRSVLREKNEKIAMLTAEFDAHRADFRSTIDTLEMASTETERVYEQRVQDLLRELQEYQDRSEDVDSVARQLKQLEELVQELEEGLEDARRGEAEARGEVEFLRGEVERGRSELKREREKAAAAQIGGDGASSTKDVEQRDDEIRGLKAIIHSLSRDAVPDSPDKQRTPTQRSGSFDRVQNTTIDARSKAATDKLERELNELRAVVETKTSREEELERQLEALRRGSTISTPLNGQRASGMTIASNGTVTQDRTSMRDSKGTVISWRERELPPPPRRNTNTLEPMHESDAYSSAAESTTPYCEICETSGHDILTCTSMFGSKQGQSNGNAGANGVFNVRHDSLPEHQLRTGKDAILKAFSPKTSTDEFKPPPLQPKKSLTALAGSSVAPGVRSNSGGGLGGVSAALALDFNGSGPVAGKESKVVNPEKWCALCERDGHDSVDCPFEDM